MYVCMYVCMNEFVVQLHSNGEQCKSNIKAIRTQKGKSSQTIV